MDEINEWVSVEEGYPPIIQGLRFISYSVWVTTEYNEVKEAFYSYNDSTWHDADSGKEVEGVNAWQMTEDR